MALIVVATDLSPAAAAAPVVAHEWARRLGAGLALLHVVHDPVLAPAFAQDVAEDVRAAQVALEQLACMLPDVAVAREVLSAEEVVPAIVDYVRQQRADWLFVGTHGRTGLQRLRLGSVAAQLVRQSPVPVVCVPPGP